jgi:hypothetical protein
MLIPGPKHRKKFDDRIPRSELQLVYRAACSFCKPNEDELIRALRTVRQHFDLRGSPDLPA